MRNCHRVENAEKIVETYKRKKKRVETSSREIVKAL